MAKVMKISYKKGERGSTRYVLDCSEWNGSDDLVVLDITKEVESEIKKDKKKGFSNDDGPCFGMQVYNAIKAGKAHEDVTARWKAANAPDNYRPKIGYPGIWRIYKAANTTILRSWEMDVEP